jgi:hypothetical protein
VTDYSDILTGYNTLIGCDAGVTFTGYNNILIGIGVDGIAFSEPMQALRAIWILIPRRGRVQPD